MPAPTPSRVLVIRLSDEKKPPERKRDGERQTGLVLDERTEALKGRGLEATVLGLLEAA